MGELVTTDRVFGEHESEAMFEAIYNALAVLAHGGATAGRFAQELQSERALLLECRAALSNLTAAVKTENFNRTGRREMGTHLRYAIRRAEEALR